NGVQYPLPTNCAKRNWRNPGQQDEKAHQPPAAKWFFQSNGKNICADHHNHLRCDRKDDRILQRCPETRALHDAAKIFEPDIMQLAAANARIAEGIEDRQAEWRADQQQDVDHGRTEHNEAQQWALRGAGRFDLRSAYCHVMALGAIFFSVTPSKNFSSRVATAKS